MHTLPFKCRYTYIYVCVCVCVCMYVCVRHGMCTHTHIPTQPPTYVHTCCAYTNIHTHTQRHTHIHHSLRNSWAPTRFIREHCKTCKWSGITLVNRKNFVVHFDKSMRKEWGWREAKGERERWREEGGARERDRWRETGREGGWGRERYVPAQLPADARGGGGCRSCSEAAAEEGHSEQL